MNIRIYALIAATFVALFYAGNFSIAKIITPSAISPFGLTWYRVLFTGILFWVLSALFGPKEKIRLRDFGFFALAALCGMSLNMLTYMWGLSLTSPINAAVLMVTTPIIVLFLSVLLLKEKLLWYRLLGILIGFSGTFLLIAQSTYVTENASNPLMGNILIFINAFAYSFYVPTQLYLKNISFEQGLIGLLVQIFWIGFFYLVIKISWNKKFEEKKEV
ncbi:MAG: DMT family transporter, partial [Flavobacteriaceae bacterium]|nr:DMT family transporter [Flavobacteriaceae bacterium]